MTRNGLQPIQQKKQLALAKRLQFLTSFGFAIQLTKTIQYNQSFFSGNICFRIQPIESLVESIKVRILNPLSECAHFKSAPARVLPNRSQPACYFKPVQIVNDIIISLT